MEIETGNDVVKTLQVARRRRVLTQGVENILHHLTTITLTRAEKGLLRECPRDILRNLTFILLVSSLSLDALIQNRALLVANLLVSSILDQA